ncbi:segregation and condensation protein B [Pedobacter sp. UYP30]|uniref:SMC-Scp complex subunit ScpB n=1 Tax=Pedobacter sp. UYP30 TaxID=1756400 RepID=UPI0033971C54
MLPANLSQHIEALIFSSAQSITAEEIMQALSSAFEESFSATTILDHLTAIEQKYLADDCILEIVYLNGGYQFLTKKDYYETVNQLQIVRSKKKLSQAAMETLAIIAYRQPITKLEIEQIRGVNSDYSVQRLLEKDLIAIEGKADGPGRPLLYQTSGSFMDYFGLKNIKDLPQLNDFAKPENSVGDEIE